MEAADYAPLSANDIWHTTTICKGHKEDDIDPDQLRPELAAV